MSLILKETRTAYGLTQKELSELTEIPLRTIENWESGTRLPSPWVEKMIASYLKQYPKNEHGIITKTKGVYEIPQIKEILLPLTLKYDIQSLILYGSYAKGTQDSMSDIDLVVAGTIKGLRFFGLLEEINQLFVKPVDLIHISDVEKNSQLHQDILNGMVLYER
jgi:predicted nucleotidyltransferase